MNINFYIAPTIIILILIYAILKKPDIIFESFINGAKNGLEASYSIAPSIIALITSVAMLKASGALEIFTNLIKPLTDFLHFPSQIVPLAILKPISGSASTAIFNNILKMYGPDSQIGRISSLIAGSTETTLYVISIYFGSINIKKIRHTIFVALIADLISLIISVLYVNFFWMY